MLMLSFCQQFLALLERNAVVNTSLQYRQMTLFAPTNQAFQRYNGEMDDSLVLFHICEYCQLKKFLFEKQINLVQFVVIADHCYMYSPSNGAAAVALCVVRGFDSHILYKSRILFLCLLKITDKYILLN